MAHLKKRGKIYYIRFHQELDGSRKTITKSLKTRHKDVAQNMLRDLSKLEVQGKIDPLLPNFDPIQALHREQAPEKTFCKNVREAADRFYQAKSYLSKATIEAYKRAIEHFIDYNKLEFKNPRQILPQHFEAIIFKQGIKTATRHYYFRHYRAWWKWLLKKRMVDDDFFETIKEDLPDLRENTRPKMINEDELLNVFKIFDQELERKKQLPEFEVKKVQHWFKPIIATYFYGGLRRNEVAYHPDLDYSGLKGENLIFEEDQIAYIYLPATKGRKERQIPVNWKLKKYLQEYLMRRGNVRSGDYVFIYQGGITSGKPVRGERVYKEFKRYIKLAGIPSTRSLHGMRHQAITTWIEDGFHTAEAGYMAGHSTQRVTEKYTHLTAKRLKDKMERISKR